MPDGSKRSGAKLKAPALDPNLTDRDIARLLEELKKERLLAAEYRAAGEAKAAAALREAEESAAPHDERAEILSAIIRAYAEKHRERLCPKGSKTVRLATGELVWRQSPSKVTLRKVADVIKRLKAKGLSRFIRTKEEVDKEAILKEPAAVKGITGITISSEETLEIKPFEHATTVARRAAGGK